MWNMHMLYVTCTLHIHDYDRKLNHTEIINYYMSRTHTRESIRCHFILILVKGFRLRHPILCSGATEREEGKGEKMEIRMEGRWREDGGKMERRWRERWREEGEKKERRGKMEGGWREEGEKREEEERTHNEG